MKNELFFMNDGFDDSGVGMTKEEWRETLEKEAHMVDAADIDAYVEFHMADLISEDEYRDLQE